MLFNRWNITCYLTHKILTHNITHNTTFIPFKALTYVHQTSEVVQMFVTLESCHLHSTQGSICGENRGGEHYIFLNKPEGANQNQES